MPKYNVSQHESYIAICVAGKDEGPALLEWVTYHLCIGVDKVYLYDDRSEPPMLEHVAEQVEEGTVHYEYIDIGRRRSLPAWVK